jgi:hypothetical protein
VPIIEDARHPHKYRMLVPMVDTIFADVAQPDQARIVALNAQYFLKNSGHFVISVKVRERSRLVSSDGCFFWGGGGGAGGLSCSLDFLSESLGVKIYIAVFYFKK